MEDIPAIRRGPGAPCRSRVLGGDGCGKPLGSVGAGQASDGQRAGVPWISEIQGAFPHARGLCRSHDSDAGCPLDRGAVGCWQKVAAKTRQNGLPPLPERGKATRPTAFPAEVPDRDTNWRGVRHRRRAGSAIRTVGAGPARIFPGRRQKPLAANQAWSASRITWASFLWVSKAKRRRRSFNRASSCTLLATIFPVPADPGVCGDGDWGARSASAPDSGAVLRISSSTATAGAGVGERGLLPSPRLLMPPPCRTVRSKRIGPAGRNPPRPGRWAHRQRYPVRGLAPRPGRWCRGWDQRSGRERPVGWL